MNSDKPDRDLASRSWRRNMNASLRSRFANAEHWDDYLLPSRYEARWNDRWDWRVDGTKQLKFFPDQRALARLAKFGVAEFEKDRQHWLKIQRK